MRGRNYKHRQGTVAKAMRRMDHTKGGHEIKISCDSMEFYAAMKKNEMLSFASKWMELENIILSEVSLAQKTKNRMFSLICRH
jgi:hypothetical protein